MCSRSSSSPTYAHGFANTPVAILGARECIFSEHIDILGDIAAGKEQTFGTLSSRALACLGGKLHHRHPDFLYALFVSTRGGVFKAQKGLHVYEDIFAGMNAFARGGRIKHSEYCQCSKGRDLGYGTILNFQTKIGAGMMLSREYYLGSQLPIDQFLTFYYGHHINNIFVALSVQVPMVALLFLGTLNRQLKICKYNSQGQYIGGQPGRYNLVPVLFDWIRRCIISIFLVPFIASMPLFSQALIRLPILFSYADTIHSIMLFWLRPSKQIRPPLFPAKVKRQRRSIVIRYGFVFVLMFCIFAALMAIPAVFRSTLDLNCPFCDLL